MSHLTKEQRYTISVLLANNFSQKDIAKAIGRHKSVVSREISRNKNDKTGKYSFTHAQMCAEVRKERFCVKRIFTNSVKQTIDKYLELEWSPEQIVGYCAVNDIKMVSIERIYQYIREDKANGGTLYKKCRHKLKHRKKPVGKHMPIKDRVSIEDRPKEADGTRFGDWEMDLIIGKDGDGAMVTLVERKTGFSIIEKLEHGKNATELSKVVVKLLFPYRDSIKTITTDNGSEFAQHKHIAKKLNTDIFFAHPYCSWEKGLIEYTNKLYRQYIPKKACFDDYNEQQIKKIQYRLNERPRKKLMFRSPKEIFFLYLNNQSCI